MAELTVELYDCPIGSDRGLRTRLTVGSCEKIKARSKRAVRQARTARRKYGRITYAQIDLMSIGVCVGCPGVLALAKKKQEEDQRGRRR